MEVKTLIPRGSLVSHGVESHLPLQSPVFPVVTFLMTLVYMVQSFVLEKESEMHRRGVVFFFKPLHVQGGTRHHLLLRRERGQELRPRIAEVVTVMQCSSTHYLRLHPRSPKRVRRRLSWCIGMIARMKRTTLKLACACLDKSLETLDGVSQVFTHSSRRQVLRNWFSGKACGDRCQVLFANASWSQWTCCVS